MVGAIKGITVEIGGDTTKLGKALADVNKKSKDLQTELRSVNSLLKLDPGNVTLLTQKQDLLNKSIESTKEKLETLKSTQAQVQAQFEKGDVTAEQYRNFQREIIATEKKLESLNDQLKDFGSVGTQQIAAAGEKVKGYGDKISAVGEKLLPVSAAIIGAGTACVATADDLKSATNAYLAATGTTAKSVKTLADGTKVVTDNTEKYKEVIEGIYNNNYGESFEDIADAMAKVKTNIQGIDDSQIQKVTESALALRDTFEYDVAESTRSINTLMDQFGITADEAFNLMTQGAQSGLDYSGEMLDSINEYSVQFAKLGLDAEDMFSVFANGAENGAFNLDKIGDAVKELSIRVVDGSDTTKEGFKLLGLNADEMAAKFAAGGDSAKEAFNQVITGLANMDDPLAQNTAGVNLFGTMWEDLGPQVVTSLSTVSDSIDSTKDSMEELKQQRYDDLKNQISQLGRTFMTDIAVPLGEQLLPIISSVISKISEWVAKFGELSPTAQKIILVVGGIIAAVGPLLTIVGKLMSTVGTIMTLAPKIVSVVKTIGVGLKGLFGIIAAHPVIAIVTAIIAAVVLLYTKCEWFRDGVNKVLTAVKDIAVKVFNALATFFTETLPNAINSVVTFFQELPGKIQAAISSLVSIVSNVFTNVKNTIMSIAENIFSRLPTGFQLVVQNVQTIFQNLVAIFQNIFGIIQTVVQTAISVIKAIFTGDFSSIPGIVSGALGKIKEFFANILDSAVTIVVNWIAMIINYFRGLGESWINIFNNIKTTLTKWWNNLKVLFVTTVKNIITSVINFFTQLPGKIYNAIVGAISRVKTWGSNLLTTAKTAASNMVNGVISFVKQLPSKIASAIQGAISRVSSWGSQMLSTAKSKMTAVVSGIVNAFKNLPSKMTSIGKNVIQGVINGISSMVSKLYSSIKNALSGLVNKAKNALGIHSPSRVFRDAIGKMIPAGIAVGIKKNEGEATCAVEDMADELADQEFSINGATINRKLNTTFGNPESANNAAAKALDAVSLMAMLQNILDKLGRLQVVLDSGELVGGIIDPIDSALNDKYNKAERGW